MLTWHSAGLSKTYRGVWCALWEILTCVFWTRKWNRGQGAGERERSNEALSYQGGRTRNILIPPPHHHVLSRTIPGRQSNNEKAFLSLINVLYLYFEVNITGNLKCMYIVVFLPLKKTGDSCRSKPYYSLTDVFLLKCTSKDTNNNNILQTLNIQRNANCYV